VIEPAAQQGGGGEAAVATLLLIAAALYIGGVARVWRSSGVFRGITLANVLAFAAGWVATTVALLSPLDEWGTRLFSWHMIQHEVLMLIAAPCLVLGRPLVAFLWAFPERERARIGRWTRRPGVRGPWRALTAPLTGWWLHALALWVWHAPVLFTLALTNRLVHDLQHVSFFATALIFWAALFETRAREAQGASIVYLLTTTIHSGVLGALITFATYPWYTPYLTTAPQLGWTALEDQQLGGLIMWVPASLVYIGFALVLFTRWIGADERAPMRMRDTR
jgi:putative membrane protein